MNNAYNDFSKDDLGVTAVYTAGNLLGSPLPMSILKNDLSKFGSLPKEFTGGDYYETGWPYFWNGTTSVSNLNMATLPMFYVIDGSTMAIKYIGTDANFALIQSLIDG